MRSRREYKDVVEQAQVSAIIPCYRCAGTIGRALTSVSAQILQPKEVILVDDCSSDGTLEELYRLQATYPEGWIKVIALPQNAGPATARNMGWDTATQPYIAFLDSDDAWNLKKIEFQYLWMRAHPEVALTGHACRYINGLGEASKSLNHEKSEASFKLVSKSRLLVSSQYATSSVMLRRELSQRFVYGKNYCEDYLLWCEICCSGLTCYRSEIPLVYFFKPTYGAGGLSGDLVKMQKGELDTYQRLYAKNYYGIGVFVCLIGLSWLKYIRRLFKVKFFGFGVDG